MASRPLRCWSMGRAPIAQPPGSDTRACPNLATSGPSTRTLARICFTSSYGASGRTLEPAATATSGVATSTRRPKKRRSAAVVSMSRSAGTLRRRLAPSDSSVAQRIGSAAFFAPLMRTEPRRGPPARMRMASTTSFLLRLGVFLCPEACSELRRVPLFVFLSHPPDGERFGWNVARHGRPGRHVGVPTYRDGCDQLRIAADEDPRLDGRRVLLHAIVVAEDRA